MISIQAVCRQVSTAAAALVLAAAGAWADAGSAAPCPAFSSSRTFVNLTGQTVDGLHLVLHGPQEADLVDTGPENPFGAPVFSDLGPEGTYHMRFRGAAVGPGQAVRIALCTDRPQLDLVPQGNAPAHYWLFEDEPVAGQALPAVGYRFGQVESGAGAYALRLELTNAERAEAGIERVEWAVVPHPLTDLSWERLSAEVSWQVLGERLTLPAAEHEVGPARLSFELPGSFRFDEPGAVVIRFTASEPDNPANAVRGVGQAVVAALLQPVFHESRAVAVVAARPGVAAGPLAVVRSTAARYPLLGRTAIHFKLQDQDGALHGVALAPDGGEVSAEALAAEEGARREAVYGTLDPDLAARHARALPDEPLPIALWLRPGEAAGTAPPWAPEPGTELSADELDQRLAEVDAHWTARLLAAAEPVVSRLADMGFPAAASTFSPVVLASLPPASIAEVARWPEVATVYLAPTAVDELEVAGPVVGGDLLRSQGWTGAGIRLGQVEIDGATPAGNPFLPGVTQDTGFSCLSAHSTGVAGIIASTHGTRSGIAPGVQLYAGGACSGQSGPLLQAANRTAAWGARAINLSWGDPTGTAPAFLDRSFDHMVWSGLRSIVKSAGNQAPPCGASSIITSPGRAYNVVTVGNADDRNSLDPADDIMGPCSSFVDPTSTNGDREKPEVAAPGTNINSTTMSSPWTGGIGSGTSFAAPVVTGGAGLLFQRVPMLASLPEATKAILMTTAVHNVEGVTRLSERDGAGVVVLDHAMSTTNTGRWGFRAYLCATAPFAWDVQTMFLSANRRTRVTLAWSTEAWGWNDYANRPSADLDLQVIAPGGSPVASSASWDNTYEIVEFVTPVSGNYRIRVVRFRCDRDPARIGWAWRQDEDNIIPGLGWEGQGADIDVVDINANGTPDLVLMVYDSPPGPNNFRYQIGWDLDPLGRTASWTNFPQVSGVGWEGQGAGMDLANLDANPRPEMVVMAYDSPPGPNDFRYIIGWNLSTAGVPTHWTGPFFIGGLGWEAQGAGLEIANLNGVGGPEMVLTAYDNPPGANTFRYKIGWDLAANGTTGNWTFPPILGGVGWEAQGAGAALRNLDGNPRPELVHMAYDNPPGANTFRYRIGWNLAPNGTPASWSGGQMVRGIGWEADGADVDIFDVDGDGTAEIFLMCYDDPPGANTFRYRVIDP